MIAQPVWIHREAARGAAGDPARLAGYEAALISCVTLQQRVEPRKDAPRIALENPELVGLRQGSASM